MGSIVTTTKHDYESKDDPVNISGIVATTITIGTLESATAVGVPNVTIGTLEETGSIVNDLYVVFINVIYINLLFINVLMICM